MIVSRSGMSSDTPLFSFDYLLLHGPRLLAVQVRLHRIGVKINPLRTKTVVKEDRKLRIRIRNDPSEVPFGDCRSIHRQAMSHDTVVADTKWNFAERLGSAVVTVSSPSSPCIVVQQFRCSLFLYLPSLGVVRVNLNKRRVLPLVASFTQLLLHDCRTNSICESAMF